MRSAELVVHVFTPLDGGPLGERGYTLLRELWHAGREELGLSRPASAIDVPTELPPSVSAFAPGALLAVQQAPADGGGVFQSVLRRHQGLLCLSAVLAPGPDGRADGFDWAPLEARWERVSAPSHSDLLDETRIYQGLLPAFDVLEGYPHAATPELAAACAPALPRFDRAPGWESRGASTISGFAVWEPGAGADHRALRRLIVLGAADREASLGAWTWSAGDTAPAPLALYLAQAAKMRLQGRVWAGGRTAERLRRRLDGAATRLGDRLAAAGLLGVDRAPGAAGLVDPDLADGLARLRAEVFHEVSVRTTTEDLRRNVEIAAANMRALTHREVIPTGYADPFREDQECAEHLVGLLADAQAFLHGAGRRAREVARVCARLGVLVAPAAGAPVDVRLTGEDRLALLDELADVYADPVRARRLVIDLGAPRRHLPVPEGHSPRDWWAEVLHELESGLVATPVRGVLRAALASYPHNVTFRAIAARYGEKSP
ncbi:CATRA conflict system CASPASE/TPR repeat-associated protein [Frankia sp. AgB32]|uniref:CATRA conflict system CASPASE/TPR repeat-associated protein n=1 Tax=Frankia sp. AgB32 TaxID=631119 RepID=UPI00200FE416|nr:CATRA conflict system CASPASE/TPR repeat-associated protein [Frankia sp. AgB32]MCK9896054.1 BN6_48550 family protein [Frankia sp. AgB32]